MPEGPEIHLAARFVSHIGRSYEFGGPIVKSCVSTKNPDIPWFADKFSLRAEARGKEMKLLLEGEGRQTSILMRFGMSGKFQVSPADDLPKHAHLRFFTVGASPRMALCFVDYRRFGRWFVEQDWSQDRGPDPMFEYEDFRQNILQNLKKPAFNRPICEAMLNQEFFNGVGNYLRAEILYRAGIRPFDQAREVLEALVDSEKKNCGTDLLELCNSVPKEVIALNAGMEFKENQKSFTDWLQCYNIRGMNNLVDSNNRTIWFTGPPGPMVPKNAKNAKNLETIKDEVSEFENNKPNLLNDFINIEDSLKASEANTSKMTRNENVKTTGLKRKRPATSNVNLNSKASKTDVKVEAPYKEGNLSKMEATHKEAGLSNNDLKETDVKKRAGKTGSSRSKCHLCGNLLYRRHKKKKCSCNKMVHKDCYKTHEKQCASRKF